MNKNFQNLHDDDEIFSNDVSHTERSIHFESKKLLNSFQSTIIPRTTKPQRDIRSNLRRSTTCVGSRFNHNEKKINYVQLYKPIYIADCAKSVNENCSYEKGDEFELINEINEEYKHLIHLRTNSECIIHQKYLQLDRETSLRLGTNDRGVIQRCLLQYNVPGAYLIRRSNTESNAFVLSIAQVSNQRHAEDWHYLIRIHSNNHQFYFVQESKLKHLSFTSFRKLINDSLVRRIIPLSEIIPGRIDFEEDLWHIPRRNLSFEFPIGRGEFGEVWRALWKHGHRVIPVAVKKLNPLKHDRATIQSFIREIETLKTLRNNFIVACYGIAQDIERNETLLITELMENGDLKKWLKLHRNVPNEKMIISYAYDVCRGMLFLEQKSFLHRDLACRNLLLSNEGKTIKIADFGLSTFVNKDDFLQSKEGYLNKLPIRWTAPEVLKDRTSYSIKSDVWSFGIVLIEIWLKGDDPYAHEKDFYRIRSLVLRGYIHRKPLQCSNKFYNQIIFPCLNYEPEYRPNFRTLVECLSQWNNDKWENENLNNLFTKSAS